MSRRSNPSRALVRLLSMRFGVNLVNFDIVRSAPWASITFTGARHELAMKLRGDDPEKVADRFLADLDVAEFDLPGHLLADIALVARDTKPCGTVRLRLEALTVEDG